MLNDLKITIKQKKLLQEISKSHIYFPELALDDLTFKNNLYIPKDPTIQDLIDRQIINKEGKSLKLTRLIAKNYWNDILRSIPIESDIITKEFLKTKSREDLEKIYHTLTSQDGKLLTTEDLIDKIYNLMKGEKMALKNKKDIAKEVKVTTKKVDKDDGMLTPKDIAKEAGLNPAVIRRVIRTMKGIEKSEDGWRITQEQAKEILETYERNQKESAELRAELVKRLQEGRKKALKKKEDKE